MTRTHTRAARWIAAVLVISGCGYSTSTALLPSHLKTIAIPVFGNSTTEVTIEQQITEAVIARFVADNHLRVVDERSADSILRGRVAAYRNSVFGFSNTTEAQEYRVTIVVDVTLKDTVKNREMWSEPAMAKTANYYVVNVPGQTARTELDGRKEAIDKIAEEIVNRTVESW
jgi:outer membrane lipopolysaccharide assembly protein LptE/RlpB